MSVLYAAPGGGAIRCQSARLAWGPRSDAVLHAVVRDHLEVFLRSARTHDDGRGFERLAARTPRPRVFEIDVFACPRCGGRR